MESLPSTPHVSYWKNTKERDKTHSILQDHIYYERLSALNLPSLQYRRMRMNFIMTYKILHDELNLRRDHFFIMNTSSTRSNGLKICKNGFNKNIRKYSFSQRIIDDWNGLPSEIANSPNLLSFKAQLDIFHNIRYQYV